MIPSTLLPKATSTIKLNWIVVVAVVIVIVVAVVIVIIVVVRFGLECAEALRHTMIIAFPLCART